MSGEIEDRIAALERQDAELGSEVRRLTERMDQSGNILEKLASQVSEIHMALFQGGDRGGYRARLTAVEEKAARIAEMGRRLDLLEAGTGMAGKLGWIVVTAIVVAVAGFLQWLARGM